MILNKLYKFKGREMKVIQKSFYELNCFEKMKKD